MQRKRILNRLSKLLRTMLRHRPHAFGLVPDAEGYVPVKELLKALGELEEGRSVRRRDLEELVHSLPDPGVELDDRRIRAAGGRPAVPPEAAPPKQLFVAIRKRAHRAVYEKGARSSGEGLLLAAVPEMALRLGRRRDARPVLVTVNVRTALATGTRLAPAGEGLFTADRLSRESLTLPAPPREKTPRKEEPAPPAAPPTPGSYTPDPAGWSSPEPAVPKRYRDRKDPGWKRERRRRSRR